MTKPFRAGRGRPHGAPGTKRVKVAFTLPPRVAGRLKEEPNQSQFVEVALIEKWARDDDLQTEDNTP